MLLPLKLEMVPPMALKTPLVVFETLKLPSWPPKAKLLPLMVPPTRTRPWTSELSVTLPVVMRPKLARVGVMSAGAARAVAAIRKAGRRVNRRREVEHMDGALVLGWFAIPPGPAFDLRKSARDGFTPASPPGRRRGASVGPGDARGVSPRPGGWPGLPLIGS